MEQKEIQYISVEFDDGRAAAMPLVWKDKDANDCYWPPVDGSKLNDYVTRRKKPNAATWSKCAITKILGYASKYIYFKVFFVVNVILYI